MISKELCWMILPIAGLLSQMGGTWEKALRRYLIPIIAGTTLWYFTGWNLGIVLMVLHLYGAFCLPVTLKGNSIPKYTINKLWLPIWGILLCSSILWLNWHYWLVSVICGLILASLVMLSNCKPTEKWFQWKFCEMFEGILALVPLCYLITLN